MKKYLTTRKSGLHIVEEKLEDNNIEPELIATDLSMFKDAIMHVRRIRKSYPSGQRQYVAETTSRICLCRPVVKNKRVVVFLFNDIQVKDEGFLEDINHILSSG
eukprot:gene37966-49765_t